MHEQPPPGDLARTVVRGASLAGAGFALTQLIGLVSYVAIARLAPPSTFGKFAAASIIVGFATIFAESGMQAALIQRRDKLEEAAATAVLATLAAGVALTSVALACAPLVGLFFQSREIGIASAALSGVLFINAATVVPDALMQRRFSFARRVVVDPLNMAAFGLAAGIALAAGMRVWGLVAAMYAAGCVRVTAAWLFVRWAPDFRRASFHMWRELVSFGRHIVASELLRQVSSIGNTALVGRALGTEPLGQFRFGQRLAIQAGTPLVTANAYVLFPAFAHIADDPPRLRAAAFRATKLLFAIAVPLGLIFVPLGTRIAVLLFGERWRGSGAVLAALCGFIVAMPVTQIATELLKAAGRPNLLPRIYTSSAVASLALMAAFLPLGAAGVAGGMSVASVGVAAYALHLVVRVIGLSLREITRALASPVLSGLAMAAIVLALDRAIFKFHPHTVLDRGAVVGLELIIAAMAYLGLLALIAPQTVLELYRLVMLSARRSKVSLWSRDPMGSSTP